MKFFVAVVLSIAVAFVHAEYKEDEGVLVLTTDNFAAAKDEFKFLLVEFCKYYSAGRHIILFKIGSSSVYWKPCNV